MLTEQSHVNYSRLE